MEQLLSQASLIDSQMGNLRDFSAENNYFPIDSLIASLNDLEIETISVADLNSEYEKSFESLQIQVEALQQVLVNMGYKKIKLDPLPQESRQANPVKVKRISSYSDSMVEEEYEQENEYEDNDDLGLEEIPQEQDILDDEITRADSPTFQLSTLSLQLLADSKQVPDTKSQERESLDSLTPPVATLPENSNRVSDSLFSSLIKSATEKEYSMLPAYVTSQVTIGYLNDVVAEINDLLTDKRFMDSEDYDCFTFAQLQEASKLSGARLKVVMAALLELHRLEAVNGSSSGDSKEYRLK